MQSPTKRLAVILYADASQYARLTELDEDGTHAILRVKLDQFAAVFEKHGGRPLQNAGDSILAEFATILGAVAAALEVQKGLASEEREPTSPRPLEFRIGINIGDVIFDRDTIYGNGVNIAERLQGLARPGEVYLSEAAYRAIEGAAQLRFEYVGERMMKHIEHPIRIYRVLPPDKAGHEANALPLGDSASYVTVLFGKLKGVEQLVARHGLEQAHRIINELADTFTNLVARLEGAPNLVSGHEYMAVFGAPEANGNDADRAIHCALEFAAAIREQSTEYGTSIPIGIGIDCGDLIVGSGRRGNSTFTGAPISIAAGLAESCQEGQILVSAMARNASRTPFRFERPPSLELDAKFGNARVWQLLPGLDAGERERSELVGRRKELRQIEGILKSTLEDKYGCIVYIRGDAGIGKTRLLNEITTVAAALGYQRHCGSASDFAVQRGQDAVGSLIASILRLGRERSLPAIEHAIATAIERGLLLEDEKAYLYDALELAAPAPLAAYFAAADTALKERRRKTILSTIVQRACQSEPIMIVIDDLHWAGSFLLDVVAELAPVARDNRLVLVLASRPEEGAFSGLRRRLMSVSSVVTLEIPPLREAEAWELAHHICDGDDAFLHDCVGKAAGNPFFLKTLLQRDPAVGSAEIPASILSLLRSRLDRLTKRDRAAIQAASVIGRKVPIAMLGFLLDEKEEDLKRLCDLQLVRATGSDLQFDHDLIRETAYRSLLDSQRWQLHKRAAEWFAGRDATMRAEHLERAADSTAADAFLEAARERFTLGHNTSALHLLERGLGLAKAATTCFDLSFLQGQVLAALGDVKRSNVAFGKALECAGSDVEASRTKLFLAANMGVLDNYAEGFRLLSDAETVLERESVTKDLARLHYLRGGLHFPCGNIDECYQEHRCAFDLAVAAQSPELQARALSGLGDAEYARGRMQSACDQFRDCVELAAENGFGRIEAANRHMIPLCTQYFGNLDQAHVEARAALEIAIKASHQRAELCAHSCLSVMQFDRGCLDEVLPHVERGEELVDLLGARRFQPLNLVYKAKVLRLYGRLEKAARLIDVALQISREVGMGYNGPRVLSELALISTDQSVRKRALEEGEAILAGGCISSNHLWFYRDAMQVALAERNYDEVDRYVSCLRSFTRSEELAWANLFCRRAQLLASLGRHGPNPAVTRQLGQLHEEATLNGLIIAEDGILKSGELAPA